MSTVISVENVSKAYRLGVIGGGALRDDLARWWARARGRPDPLLKVGQKDHGNRSGETVWALRDVSFEVKQGEILGIIGRNGAGKSTLLKILSQVTAPTSGQVKVKGRIASLLEVGTGFHPELTGRENIFLNGAILGMTRCETAGKLDEIMAFAEVDQYVDTPVKRYSSGMYVRLAFAVAAHLDPEILVVDEVLAVGDAAFQRKCLGKMKSAAQGGRTVLFVSHNIQAIRQLCSRGLWMKQGTACLAGDADSATSAYLQNTIPLDIGCEWVFPFDGHKDFQMTRVSLVDAQGVARGRFHCDEEITICIDSVSRRPIPSLYGYLSISTVEGVRVLVSDSTDVGENAFDSLAAGSYRHHIRIPSRLLGAGDYQVDVSFASIANVSGFAVDSPGHSILRFTLSDYRTSRGDSRGGYISHLLTWNRAGETAQATQG